MRKRRLLARSIEVNRPDRIENTNTLSILTITYRQEEFPALLSFEISPYEKELPGVETVDFVPVIKEIENGRLILECPPSFIWTDTSSLDV